MFAPFPSIASSVALIATCFACATTEQAALESSRVDSAQASADIEAQYLLMDAKYRALFSQGNLFQVFQDFPDFDLDKFEHYSLLKEPGSVYDSDRFLIEFYRDTFSIPDKTGSDGEDNPVYYASVHYTGPWAVERDTKEEAKAQRPIFSIRRLVSESDFAALRRKLNVEEFVTRSKSPDDGVTTTHLNLYTFDLTQKGQRDLVYVGWEGFDRFGETASTLQVFFEEAKVRFPELVDAGVFTSKAPSTSTQRVEK